MQSIRLTASKSYDILIGRGLLADCGLLTARVKAPCRAMLVCDSHVAPLYAQQVATSYTTAGFTVSQFVFPAGEASKNLSTLTQLLNCLGANGFTRSDLLVALGGGVTGDLGGFAAAVYERGIDFVQLPTTLLAAVDSSVGGKTAVDLDCGKNMAGCFWQPCLVICDCDTFATLPLAVFADGMGEVIKYGAILDESLFELLEHCDINAELEQVVFRCCTLKKDVVQADERDTGGRAILNFGHTMGHAVEKVSGFAISHGSAVAIGMVGLSRAAEAEGLTPAGTANRISALAQRYQLPVFANLPLDALQAAARADKKRSSGGIDVVITPKLGTACTHKLTLSQLDAWFALAFCGKEGLA